MSLPVRPEAALHAHAEPSPDCPLCPRLAAFRAEWRQREPGWFNAPVPPFMPLAGPASVRLAIVGLAPGLRGANRTGRPFTGDYAGDLLYRTLTEFGFARGSYEARPDDGLELIGAAIVNAVRCVPPQNKPTPLEITTCRQFLTPALASFPSLKVIVTLGAIGHNSTVRALGQKLSAYPFRHGEHRKVGPIALISSYHCSRYNTNTGVLTEKMFFDVFRKAAEVVGVRQ